MDRWLARLRSSLSPMFRPARAALAMAAAALSLGLAILLARIHAAEGRAAPAAMAALEEAHAGHRPAG